MSSQENWTEVLLVLCCPDRTCVVLSAAGLERMTPLDERGAAVEVACALWWYRKAWSMAS